MAKVKVYSLSPKKLHQQPWFRFCLLASMGALVGIPILLRLGRSDNSSVERVSTFTPDLRSQDTVLIIESKAGSLRERFNQNLYSQALALGRANTGLSKTAQISEHWKTIAGNWEKAISYLSQIPENSPTWEESKVKADEYKKYLSFANQTVEALLPPDEFLKAGNTMEDLIDRDCVTPLESPNLDDYDYLDPDSFAAFQAASRKRTAGLLARSACIQAIKTKLGVNPQPRASSGSSGSGSGRCDFPWQRDSAGRRCGKRAASERPGGRNP